MQFKGQQFRRSRTVVPLPSTSSYVEFGRAVPQGKPIPKQALPAPGSTWPDGSQVYAVPILLKGHSRTNMAYGVDGRTYLMVDGQVYTAR